MPKFGSYHIPFGGREHEQKLQCRKATSKTEISCCPIIGLYDSGVAHFSFTSEKKCYAEVRKLVQALPSGFEDKQSYKGLSYDGGVPSLEDLIPEDDKVAYSMHNLIMGIADENSFIEVHKGFAPNMITGFAKVDAKAIRIKSISTYD